MKEYRFKLEPYKGISTRHTCPTCLRLKCFSRYIDTEAKIEFPENVGRCDHEQHCGYHYTPKEFFADNPRMKEIAIEKKENYYQPFIPPKPIPPPEPSFIDNKLVEETMQSYPQNKLFLFLSERIGTEEAMQLMKAYKVGTSKHWDGATVFWQTDIKGRVRTGKVMLYNSNSGKRIKEPFSHITWVHSLLALPSYNLQQCFFGEHLLSAQPDKPLALVESEKTALIASFYLPQYIWLATGGKHGCFKKSNLSPLNGRKIVLFPDLGAGDYWQEKMVMMRAFGLEVQFFDYLEKHAPMEDRQNGYDIADYLLQIKPKENPLKALIRENPELENLIKKLNLELVNERTKKISPPKRKGIRR